ncbi:MAG: hypothetical protein J0L97_08430 [Alphaproteobacteria bacterium]|nr:hypothetical protein [Alphaproteobacteria bacterium]
MSHHDRSFQWTRRIAASLPPQVQEKLFGPVIITPEMMVDAVALTRDYVAQYSREHRLDVGTSMMLVNFVDGLKKNESLLKGGTGEEVHQRWQELMVGTLSPLLLTGALETSSELQQQMTPLYMMATAKLGEAITAQNPRFEQYSRNVQYFETGGPVMF